MRGRWKVPELFGTAVVVSALCLSAYCLLLHFLPAIPATMDYSCLDMGFFGIISKFYYLLCARKTYKGPIVDVER